MRFLSILATLLLFAQCAHPLAPNWPDLRPDPTYKSPDGIQQTVDEELEPAEQERRKYFHEPDQNLALEHHYDVRFFKEVLSYEDRVEGLRHLGRSYFSTMAESGASTWLAHGSLLGWYWNKQVLPWDSDLDVQITKKTLDFLMQQGQNGSVHEYVWPPRNPISRVWRSTPMVDTTYMLDISPHSATRVRGDAMNVIDARWIDTSNGLFIDITVVAETNPERQPGIWACKNYHRYHTSQIWPLRKDVFEGVAVYIPQKSRSVLLDEYPEGLTATELENHRWDPQVRRWRRLQEPVDSTSEHQISMESWRWM